MTYTLIAHTELGSSQTAITFSSIPATFTDLVLKFSVRSDKTAAADGFINLKINTSTANFTTRVLYGSGSGSGVSFASTNYAGGIPTNGATASTFGNGEFYFPNYAGGANKSFSLDTVMEHNAATFVTQMIIAGLWSQTTAINAVEIYPGDATNFVQYSSATLYGITSGSSGGVVVS
jgi:hypothetical protein